MKQELVESEKMLMELPPGSIVLTSTEGSLTPLLFEKTGDPCGGKWRWLHPMFDGKPIVFEQLVDKHPFVYVVWTPQDGVKGNHDMCAQLRWDTGDMWMFVHPNGEASSSLPVLTEREAKKLGYRVPVFSEEVGQQESRSAVMTVFKASSGLTVEVSGPGNIRLYGVDGHNRLRGRDYLDNLDMDALSEFFSQERKEELPFRHGDCWVFPIDEKCGRRRVVVVDGGGYGTYSEDSARSAQQAHSRPSLEAAVAWFDAHPEPKPWLGAQSGEVWSISDDYDIGGLAVCRREPTDDGDDHPYFYGPDFDGVRGDALTAGTRLEVQS